MSDIIMNGDERITELAGNAKPKRG